MADNEEALKEDILLIAQVKAYFLSGETIDLLPFRHEEDVRAEVNKFIAEWVKSGFLLKDNFLYPWHQVKAVEVASVQALTHAQAATYLAEWQQDSQKQKAFWKTRKTKAREEEEKKG